MAKRVEDWPKVRSAYERAAEEVNQRNALKVNAASVDAVWDVAFRELAIERRAKALYERQAIDLLVEFAGPGAFGFCAPPIGSLTVTSGSNSAASLNKTFGTIPTSTRRAQS